VQDIISLPKPSAAVFSFETAKAYVTHTAVARERLLGLGDGATPRILDMAGAVALPLLQDDTGFRQKYKQTCGISTDTVYAAVQQAAAQPGSDSWDLGKFLQYICRFLTAQNEALREELTAYAAEAVLSIAGQLVVVPVRSDCLRFELRQQASFSSADLSALQSMLPHDSIHTKLFVTLESVLKYTQDTVLSSPAGSVYSGQGPAVAARSGIRAGVLVLLPGGCANIATACRAYLQRGVQSVFKSYNAASQALEHDMQEYAAGGSRSSSRTPASAFKPCTEHPQGSHVHIALTEHSNRLLFDSTVKSGNAAGVLGIVDGHHTSLALIRPCGMLLAQLPLASKHDNTRTRKLLVVSDWEGIRRALLHSLPGFDDHTASAVLSPASVCRAAVGSCSRSSRNCTSAAAATADILNASQPDVCCVQLQLCVRGSTVSYDPAAVHTAHELLQQEMKLVATSVSMLQLSRCPVVVPLSWHSSLGKWAFSPLEWQMLQIGSADFVALFQRSDSMLVGIGIVQPNSRSLARLTLLGNHASASLGTTTTDVCMMMEDTRVSISSIAMGQGQDSMLLQNGHLLSCFSMSNTSSTSTGSSSHTGTGSYGGSSSSSSGGTSPMHARELPSGLPGAVLALQDMSADEVAALNKASLTDELPMLAARLGKTVHDLQVKCLSLEVLDSQQAYKTVQIDSSYLKAVGFGLSSTLKSQGHKYKQSAMTAFSFLTDSWSYNLAGQLQGTAGQSDTTEQLDITGQLSAVAYRDFQSSSNTLYLPAAFSHGAGISGLLDTGKVTVAALYSSTAPHRQLIAVLPMLARGPLQESIVHSSGKPKLGSALISHFRQCYDTIMGAAYTAMGGNTSVAEIIRRGHRLMQWELPLPLEFEDDKRISRNSMIYLDYLFERKKQPVILRLDSVKAGSSVRPTPESLADLGLAVLAQRSGVKLSDIQVVPLLATVIVYHCGKPAVHADVHKEWHRCDRVWHDPGGRIYMTCVKQRGNSTCSVSCSPKGCSACAHGYVPREPVQHR